MKVYIFYLILSLFDSSLSFYLNNRISTSVTNYSTDKKDECLITTSDIFSLDSIRSTLVRQGIHFHKLILL